MDLLRLDFIFRTPEIQYVRERSRLNRNTWTYLFNLDQPIDGRNTPWHCCDIPYFFHNIDLVEYPHGFREEGLAEKVQEEAFGILMSLAARGTPRSEEFSSWKASTTEKESILLLDRNTRVRENHDHALVEALNCFQEDIMKAMQAARGQIQH